MNRAPAERHSPARSIQLCLKHHKWLDGDVYVGRKLKVKVLTERGADGPMLFELDGIVWREE